MDELAFRVNRLKETVLPAPALFACLALLAGCASAPPPRPAVLEDAPLPQKIDRGPTSMESEIGGLNEEAMDRAFASLAVDGCIQQGSAKLGELGGAFKLNLRINREGSARWVYLSQTTLGDRDTEKCLMDLARAKNWPKPVGGEGLADKTYEIEPRAAPLVVDEKLVRRDVARARQEAAKCRRGVGGTFLATVHIRADGRVANAGIAVPSAKGEGVADCVVDAIRKLKFRAPASKASKLTFELE